jgi:hypothetical protein
MAYPIGTVLNGKVWSGENYGWQSRATHNKLKEQGKFRVGTQALDRVGSSLKRLLPAPIKQAAKAVQSHMAENDRRVAARDAQTPVGRYFINPTKAVTQAPAKVQQSLVNKASEVTNIDPRIVGVAAEVGTDFLLGKAGSLRGVPRAAAPTPLVTRQSRGGGVQRGIQRQVQASRGVPVGEVGAIYPAGHPRAGTVKQGGALRTQYPDKINNVEDALEAFYKNTNEAGGKLSKAYPPDKRTVYDFGDGTEAYAFDGGNFNFANRSGIRLKTRPSANKPNPLPNASTKVQAPPLTPKPIPVPAGEGDVADRLIKDWQREQTYRQNMDIYRNDMLYQEKLLQDVADSGLLPPKALGTKPNKLTGEKGVKGINDEIAELRRSRRDLVSEPSYIYEDTISKPPADIEQVHKGIYNAEGRERVAAAPIKGTQAHHQGSVSSVESYLQNMSVDEVRETLDILTEMGYQIGSSKHGFMNLSNAAHTNRAGPYYKHVKEWGDDFAHVGGEGRFKAPALPKGTTPQQAAEAMRPMLDEQRALNQAAWMHPAEQAMRRFSEEVMGAPVEWSLPQGMKNHSVQNKASVEKGLNASLVSEAFAKGFAQGKTYEQIANELKVQLSSPKPIPTKGQIAKDAALNNGP